MAIILFRQSYANSDKVTCTSVWDIATAFQGRAACHDIATSRVHTAVFDSLKNVVFIQRIAPAAPLVVWNDRSQAEIG